MKKVLFILGLIGLLANTTPANAVTVVEKPMGYIAVTTTSTGSVTPTIAKFCFTVETTDVSSQRAVDRNAQITERVIDAIKANIKTDKSSQIKTTNYSLTPNYVTDSKTDTTKLINHTVRNTIEVKTAFVDRVGELISIGVNNNVTKVSNVVFSTEKEIDGTESAIEEAITKARNIAKHSALQMNQKIVGIKSLQINTYQQSGNGYRLLSAEKSTASVPIEKGNVQYNVTVNAEFYVK